MITAGGRVDSVYMLMPARGISTYLHENDLLSIYRKHGKGIYRSMDLSRLVEPELSEDDILHKPIKARQLRRRLGRAVLYL